MENIVFGYIKNWQDGQKYLNAFLQKSINAIDLICFNCSLFQALPINIKINSLTILLTEKQGGEFTELRVGSITHPYLGK